MKVREFIDTIDKNSVVDVYAELPAVDCLLASTFGSGIIGKEVYEDVVSLYDHLTISQISYRQDKKMSDNIEIIINFK